MSSGDGGKPTKFGFRVEKQTTDEFGVGLAEPLWTVSLPHQCDRWRIDNESHYDPPSFKEEAVAELEEFIRQAQEALKALKEDREHGTG